MILKAYYANEHINSLNKIIFSLIVDVLKSIAMTNVNLNDIVKLNAYNKSIIKDSEKIKI
jgi:hypothetical protein